ncbi:IS200/IS605 family accessory protein TnpB-related protein [Oceanirhabdus sp. W0125-5]|uniref:IS200/IS605 family accessory protein TnpB-related protein n=1 Tax=Oceanirhabdus sp. W0125-5 TaxID=2999116 RepID=UPI0022F3029E|nr:IS200/IS605 family accessory protein TnpB-related protein [Oceanirhabdus sp. W0125-5]WBW96557.1 IS200/IS605 family accessory protein TnpB-related protein [Oceanirhabdus sp. W0125-5]
MKITMKAMLINLNDEQKSIIDNMMVVFCTAIRFSFNRLIEGQIKKGELEKIVAKKYNLNIRQAKDAVENARQIITSQKELLKDNINNYKSKIRIIEMKLKNEKLSKKKRNALLSKLDKRKRRLAYFQSFADKNTIPPVVFGGKEIFLRRCKGLITNQEWKQCRNNRFYSRGDKTKKGNPNLRVIINNGQSFLEISTLEKVKNNRAIKIQVPIYLPQKLSKKTGKVNGNNYRGMFLKHLQTSEAYQVEIIKRNGKYYAHITFELPKVDIVHTGHNGIIGIDTNPDGFALTMINNRGNYKWDTYLKQGELQYARSNRRENLCGELAKEVILIAKTYGCGIAVEDLKFKNDKDVNSKFSRVKHQFIYSKLIKMLESACIREGVEIVKVKPQFTSKIGLYKYCHQYGMEVHNGAGMVIARRSYGFKERVSKILIDKLVDDKDKFNKKNEWSKWSEIRKNIKRKVGDKPDLWIVNRKKSLGLASYN